MKAPPGWRRGITSCHTAVYSHEHAMNVSTSSNHLHLRRTTSPYLLGNKNMSARSGSMSGPTSPTGSGGFPATPTSARESQFHAAVSEVTSKHLERYGRFLDRLWPTHSRPAGYPNRSHVSYQTIKSPNSDGTILVLTSKFPASPPVVTAGEFTSQWLWRGVGEPEEQYCTPEYMADAHKKTSGATDLPGDRASAPGASTSTNSGKNQGRGVTVTNLPYTLDKWYKS